MRKVMSVYFAPISKNESLEFSITIGFSNQSVRAVLDSRIID